MMQDWPEVSKTRVAHMTRGDFYGSEKALTVGEAGTAAIEFVGYDGGDVATLKSGIPLLAGEIIDCAAMSVAELREFYAGEMDRAKA